jgi:hypothetical protein
MDWHQQLVSNIEGAADRRGGADGRSEANIAFKQKTRNAQWKHRNPTAECDQLGNPVWSQKGGTRHKGQMGNGTGVD